MTLQQLPERANLEQLKKQAKSLLAAARSQEPNAIQRFEAVLIGRSLKPDAIALHDAQFVLAREYGFKSWTALKQEVEERSLSFAAAVDEFVRCATGSAPERAMRLLARHAGIANANLYTELVLGDADAVETRLKANPAIARQRGGVQQELRKSHQAEARVGEGLLLAGDAGIADGAVREFSVFSFQLSVIS